MKKKITKHEWEGETFYLLELSHGERRNTVAKLTGAEGNPYDIIEECVRNTLCDDAGDLLHPLGNNDSIAAYPSSFIDAVFDAAMQDLKYTSKKN